MNAPRDTWQNDARIRLLRHVLVATKSGRDYAPDSRYEGRTVVTGPHTIAIADTLHRWAAMWAQDMREDRANGGDYDQEKAWKDCMHLADQEIDRYLANNHLTRAA